MIEEVIDNINGLTAKAKVWNSNPLLD